MGLEIELWQLRENCESEAARMGSMKMIFVVLSMDKEGQAVNQAECRALIRQSIHVVIGSLDGFELSVMT
jgi:hypothetical protein